MRQSGILAAAGIVALNEMPKKIINDHKNASNLAKGLNAISGISIDLEKVKTNIIYFKLDHSKIDSVTLINSMLKKNIKFFELGPNWFRLVTHAGINEEDIEHVLIQLKDLFSKI